MEEDGMFSLMKIFSSVVLGSVLTLGAAAQDPSATRYDASITSAATQKLAQKSQFKNVNASVEDRIVTLTGTVDLYQDKFDAAKSVRKLKNSTGVRNLIVVTGPQVAD